MRATASWPRRSRRARAATGFTLVELLIAALVVGLVLAAAWGWLWGVGRAATRSDYGAQAATAAAAATRTVTADLACATAVLPPPAGRDAAGCLHLRHDHVGAAPETTVICWDPARHVLWRNAPGTYLSDHVIAFAVTYMNADGHIVSGADVVAGEWASLRLAHVAVSVEVGGVVACRSASVALGPS